MQKISLSSLKALDKALYDEAIARTTAQDELDEFLKRKRMNKPELMRMIKIISDENGIYIKTKLGETNPELITKARSNGVLYSPVDAIITERAKTVIYRLAMVENGAFLDLDRKEVLTISDIKKIIDNIYFEVENGVKKVSLVPYSETYQYTVAADIKLDGINEHFKNNRDSIELYILYMEKIKA